MDEIFRIDRKASIGATFDAKQMFVCYLVGSPLLIQFEARNLGEKSTVGLRFHTETVFNRFSGAQNLTTEKISLVWAYNPKMARILRNRMGMRVSPVDLI